MKDIIRIIDNLADKSAKSSPDHDEDYIGENGLLYCGKCHTPKQCKVEILGNDMTPYIPCECRKKELEDEIVNRLVWERKLNTEKNRQICFPDKRLISWTFSNANKTDNNFIETAAKYCLHFKEMSQKGLGLMFYGEVGIGKTFAAACIANKLVDQGITVLMTDFSRIINTLWGMNEGKQEYLDSLNKCELLIIDDFAAQRDTVYANEIVMNVIDSRCKSGKPLIITTNLNAKEIFEPVNMGKKRIYSRLCELCIPVKCEGNIDYRKKQMAENVAEYGEILGVTDRKIT